MSVHEYKNEAGKGKDDEEAEPSHILASSAIANAFKISLICVIIFFIRDDNI